MIKYLSIVAVLFIIVLLLASCTYTPRFVEGETYIVEGNYTSMHTENGSYIYVIGGNTIILGNKQEQPSLNIGKYYHITWKLISEKPEVVEIVSFEEK